MYLLTLTCMYSANCWEWSYCKHLLRTCLPVDPVTPHVFVFLFYERDLPMHNLDIKILQCGIAGLT